MKEKSNNDIMWDCVTDILKNNVSDDTKYNVYRFTSSYIIYEGKEVEYNFSFDNWMAVTCWQHFFNIDKSVPLLGMHSRHPMRFLLFSWMKYKALYPLRVFTILDILVKYGIIRRKTKTGVYHTSGLLLSYYIAYSYKQKITMWILTKLMKTMFDSWEEVFTIYHGNINDYNYKVLESFKEMNNNVDVLN